MDVVPPNGSVYLGDDISEEQNPSKFDGARVFDQAEGELNCG